VKLFTVQKLGKNSYVKLFTLKKLGKIPFCEALYGARIREINTVF